MKALAWSKDFLTKKMLIFFSVWEFFTILSKLIFYCTIWNDCWNHFWFVSSVLFEFLTSSQFIFVIFKPSNMIGVFWFFLCLNEWGGCHRLDRILLSWSYLPQISDCFYSLIQLINLLKYRQGWCFLEAHLSERECKTFHRKLLITFLKLSYETRWKVFFLGGIQASSTIAQTPFFIL